jgi:hypothetical protein
MRAILYSIISLVLLACTGCIEISRFSVKHEANGYVLGLRRDFKGVTLGMCGPMTGAYLERELWFKEKKSRYEASEVRSRRDGRFDSEVFTEGYVAVDWERGEVEIMLKGRYGDYDLNGRFTVAKPPIQTPQQQRP